MGALTASVTGLPDPAKLLAGVKALYAKAPRACAQLAVNHFERNFELGGFVDDRLERWPKRRMAEVGGKRGLLIGSTRALSHSLRVLATSPSGFTVGTNVPYAAIHNNGGTIKVTAKMRGFFWFKCREAQGARAKKKDGAHRNDTRNRKLNAEAEMWKALALSKQIKIPKRQFIGPSAGLNRAIDRYFTGALTTLGLLP